MDIFTSEQLQTLLVVAIITSFIVSAFNQLQVKVSSPWLLAITAFVVTVLKTTFTAVSFSEWQALLTSFLLTMAFSVLFWMYVGKFLIDPFFAWLKKKLLDKFNPTGTGDGK